jgi:hypothetical protein
MAAKLNPRMLIKIFEKLTEIGKEFTNPENRHSPDLR